MLCLPSQYLNFLLGIVNTPCLLTDNTDFSDSGLYFSVDMPLNVTAFVGVGFLEDFNYDSKIWNKCECVVGSATQLPKCGAQIFQNISRCLRKCRLSEVQLSIQTSSHLRGMGYSYCCFFHTIETCIGVVSVEICFFSANVFFLGNRFMCSSTMEASRRARQSTWLGLGLP